MDWRQWTAANTSGTHAKLRESIWIGQLATKMLSWLRYIGVRMGLVFLVRPSWLRHPLAQVAFLGLLSWIACLPLATRYPLGVFVARYPLTDFGRATDWSKATLMGFLWSVMGAFVLYLIAWQVARSARRQSRLVWLVIAFGVLYALTLMTMYPITATDLFDYVFYSRMLVRYGSNPLAVQPITFQNDPFFRTVIWSRQPSPYGPLWILLTVPGSLIAGNDLTLNLLLMKGLAVLFYIGCALLIWAILRHKNPEQIVPGTLLFAWNPLVLFEAAGNGHNDIIMMFFVLLSIFFLVRRRWVWVLPALLASVLVKYVTAILVLPFLIYLLQAHVGWRDRLIFLGKTTALSIALVGSIAAPFAAVPAGLVDEAHFCSLLSIPTLAFHFLKNTYGEKPAKDLILAATTVLYAVVYVISLRYLRKPQHPCRLIVLSVWLILAYLAIGSMYFQPWFVVWPIALGIWANHPHVRRVLLVFTVSALLSYALDFYWVWNFKIWQRLDVNLRYVVVIFLPPMAMGILGFWRGRAGLIQNYWKHHVFRGRS
jgi:hypothetical protein